MSTTNPYTTPGATVDNVQDDFYQPKVFTFSGRIGRLRYLAYNMAWNLVALGIATVIGIASAVLTSLNDALAAIGILGLFIAYLMSIVAGFAMAVRRLNDMNSSGWLSLLMLLPLVNLVLALVLIFAPGTKATNNYGEQPTENTAGVYVAALVVPFGLIPVIGILAAVALPAYQDYTLRAKTTEVISESYDVREKIEMYYAENERLPEQNRDINHSYRSESPNIESIDVTTGGIVTIVIASENENINGKTVVYRPSIDQGYIEWDCSGGDLAQKYRPVDCR